MEAAGIPLVFFGPSPCCHPMTAHSSSYPHWQALIRWELALAHLQDQTSFLDLGWNRPLRLPPLGKIRY